MKNYVKGHFGLFTLVVSRLVLFVRFDRNGLMHTLHYATHPIDSTVRSDIHFFDAALRVPVVEFEFRSREVDFPIRSRRFSMWSYASRTIAGTFGRKRNSSRHRRAHSEFSDEDELAINSSREEGLECPICWENFNVVENVPYVLWCGHSLCKNCVLGLQRAIVRFSTLPLQLPLFVSCPWCNLLSFRLVYNGILQFPRKNFFLLWMVESMNGNRTRAHSSMCSDHKPALSMNNTARRSIANCRTRPTRRPIQPHHQLHPGSHFFNRYLVSQNVHASLHKSFVFFARLMAKFPLIIIFILIGLYAIPVAVTVLAVYVLVTVLFAIPSFLVLYFAYPSLDWLIKKIVN